MTEHTAQSPDLKAFEDFLLMHGSDKTRWPAKARLTYAELVSKNEDAARLLREAEALDRLIEGDDHATPSAAHCEALADKICAAAFEDQTDAQTASGPYLASETPALDEAEHATQDPIHRPAVTSDWPAAALLAASLVLGVVGGSVGLFDSAIQPVVAVGQSVVGPQEVALAATDPASLLFEGSGSSIAEDLL